MGFPRPGVALRDRQLTSPQIGISPMRLILLILVILLLLGALPAWPYSRGWGYAPVGGLGLVLIIVIVLILLGIL
jgi:hypothetical protein